MKHLEKNNIMNEQEVKVSTSTMTENNICFVSILSGYIGQLKEFFCAVSYLFIL